MVDICAEVTVVQNMTYFSFLFLLSEYDLVKYSELVDLYLEIFTQVEA